MGLRDRILTARNQRGWTQRELAHRLAEAMGKPCHATQVHRWEKNGGSSPDADQLAALSMVFGRSVDWLLQDHIERVVPPATDAG